MSQQVMTNYPNGFLHGVLLRGVPIVQMHPGRVFWVGNSATKLEGEAVAEDDPNKGSFYEPFATIDYAVGRCAANRGDIIVVRPGHSEDIAAAGSLTLDVAGVAIVGLGSGTDRPDLNFSATAGTVELDAANCAIVNCTLTADISAVVVGVNVDADYCTLERCEFNFNETGDDFVTMVDADTVTGFHALGCTFHAEEAAGCDEAIRLDTAHQTVLRGNHFTGDFTDAAIIGEGAASLGILIDGNVIYNPDTTAGLVIDLNVACTGMIVRNLCTGLLAAAPDGLIDPGSCGCCENYVSNAIDESGTIVPVTLST